MQYIGDDSLYNLHVGVEGRFKFFGPQKRKNQSGTNLTLLDELSATHLKRRC